MKKITPLLIVGMLVLIGLEAVANQSTENKFYEKEQEKMAFTHTVLVEFATATFAWTDTTAHEALKEIYSEGQYPFYYISLVYDKNTKASQRCYNDYNFAGTPTLWFDGGYEVSVAYYPVEIQKTKFIDRINSCGNRSVEDVDINLVVTWLGGTKMEINVAVTNNQISKYAGYLRVYITEIESSIGWYDHDGQLYTFPLLDYAFNQNISIPGKDSWIDKVTWDGSPYFPSITKDNIMVIAAVFNDEPHQGYSFPPNSHPFWAYYVDECNAAKPIDEKNDPPASPTITGRTRGKAGQWYNYSFNSIDPNGDKVYYFIDWGDDTNTSWIGPYTSGVNVIESHRWFEGTYTIKAKSKDIFGNESNWATLEVSIPRTYNYNTFISDYLSDSKIFSQY